MADNEKIYHLQSIDNSGSGAQFKVVKVIDFSEHELNRDIQDLKERDWAHVFMSDRSLSFDGKTYNLSTSTVTEFKTPSNYFGQKLDKKDHKSSAQSVDKDKSDDP